MSFFVGLLETIAVFIPDFLVLGLVTLAFFNLCCIEKTLHVAGTLDTDSALQVTLAMNITGSLLNPERSTITSVAKAKSRVEQVRREPSPATPKPQPVGHKNAAIES